MRSNKLIVIFLLKFFGTYALLFFLYSYYLNVTQSKEDVFACAPITNQVADQTAELLNVVGYDSRIEQHTEELSMRFFIDDYYVARVTEGCNAVSIIILFISFIVAFSGKFTTTLLYIIFGSLIIYVVNIFRIAFISIALYKFPEYRDLLHDIVFPTIIYGITFVLWFVWVRIFSKK